MWQLPTCNPATLYLCAIGAIFFAINNFRISITSLSERAIPPKSLPSRDNNNIASALQCLDLNQEMDSLISRARQVYVTMPAKGGGKSMNNFALRCGHSERPQGLPFDKWHLLLDSSMMNSSSIISSHIRNHTSLIHLAKRSNKNILMIYIHREEGDRVISAIKMIAHHICHRKDKHRYKGRGIVVAKNRTHCIIDEQSMGKMISEGHREVGGGLPSILTCSVFDALQLNRPQFVFLHYEQVDKLQTLLAKHHCPELLDELPIRMNTASDELRKDVFLYDSKGDANNETIGVEEILRAKSVVPIQDWLHAKGAVLEGSLASLRQSNERIASCQKEAAQMQIKLFGCTDEALKVEYTMNTPKNTTVDEERRMAEN